MWQFKSNHIRSLFDRSFTSSFEMFLNAILFPQATQVAQVSFTQKLHFFSGLAQLLIGGLVFPELRRNILEHQ